MSLGMINESNANHPTLPFLMVAALMKPAFVLSLIPCQITNPSASVLKC